MRRFYWNCHWNRGRYTRPCACSCAYSSSVNSRERTRKRTPSPFSSENMPPRPLTTSMISCVCFQYSNCEVLQAIRSDARTRALPVVVLTTSDEPFDIEATYALGVNSYIRKPVDFEQFVAAVKQIGLYWLVLNQPRVAS